MGNATFIVRNTLAISEKDLFGNDQTLNLTGSLIDLEDLGVSHQFLYGILLIESVATEDLDRIDGDFHCHIGTECFCEGGFLGVAESFVLHIGGFHT